MKIESLPDLPLYTDMAYINGNWKYYTMDTHRHGLVDGFTKKYNVHKLVYYEEASYMRSALEREKQLKGWTRAKKNALIQTVNPEWKDLSDNWDR